MLTRYLFTFLLFLSVQAAQAQAQLIISAIRLATTGAILAAEAKNAPKNVAPTAPAALTIIPARYTTPFTFRGETISRRRTAADQLKGKGAAEILALEASLEQAHTAFIADSVQSFFPASQYDAIIAAARKASAARPNWDYSPYQQELAFYQKEEDRRQKASSKPTAPSEQTR